MAAQQDSDEEDYMSEKILNQCTSTSSVNLPRLRQNKRELDIHKKHRDVKMTKAEKEEKRLKSMEDALKAPIPEDNIGFKMMKRMGFKPGQALGSKGADEGIKVPVEINIRQGRSGLGKRKHDKEALKKVEAKVASITHEEFRRTREERFKSKETFGDLRKAQFACRCLDEEEKRQPPEIWFWPVDPSEGGEEGKKKKRKSKSDNNESSSSSSEEEDDNEIEEIEEEIIVPDDVKLEKVMEYLKSTYFYCVWCGTRFTDKEDMTSSCPGNDKDDH